MTNKLDKDTECKVRIGSPARKKLVVQVDRIDINSIEDIHVRARGLSSRGAQCLPG